MFQRSCEGPLFCSHEWKKGLAMGHIGIPGIGLDQTFERGEKWKHDWSSQLSSCEIKAWKKFMTEQDSKPWLLRYRSVLYWPTELSSHDTALVWKDSSQQALLNSYKVCGCCLWQIYFDFSQSIQAFWVNFRLPVFNKHFNLYKDRQVFSKERCFHQKTFVKARFQEFWQEYPTPFSRTIKHSIIEFEWDNSSITQQSKISQLSLCSSLVIASHHVTLELTILISVCYK